MKSRVKKRVIALMLCMVMVLSSGISTLAEGDAGTPEATEEVSSTNDESAVNTEPDTAVAEESQSRSNTAVETETAAEENAPAEAEAQPKTAEAAPAENTETDAAAQTPVEETQTAETKDNAADAQSTEQSAENGEAVQEETTTPETENETAQNTETAPQPYEGKYEDDTIKITVNAEAGIVPEGAELSVTPIEKTKITDDMTAEEKAEAEKINDQYDLTEQKLNEDSEENEVTMEGFLAYDISFLVNGAEVEPSGDVNVVMEFQEAAIPEGVSEDADVTVKHLKEDETAEDGVIVEDMAEKAEVQTTDKAEVEKVELTADSFSVYSITWQADWYADFTINFHYVYLDENGNFEEIPDEVYSPSYELQLYVNQQYDLHEYIADGIPNYTYADKIVVDNENGAEITTLTTKRERGSWGRNTYYVGYSGENSTEEKWLSSASGEKRTGDIYFVYEYTPARLSIEDNIMIGGDLKAVYNPIGDETVKEYIWYRADEETPSDFQEVAKITFEDGHTNISDNGISLYPAWDKIDVDGGETDIDKSDENGARKWYRVKAVLSDDSTVESTPYQVPYYNELKNGSFETPAIADAPGHYQFTNEEYKEQDGVWQSTGAANGNGVAIEIIREGYASQGNNGEASYNWNSDGDRPWSDAAIDEEQFAELNCEAAGALYQDVLTMEGRNLNFWLSHRARGNETSSIPEYDTMYLVIMPTSEAVQRNLTTQENLQNYLLGLNADGITFDEKATQIEQSLVYNDTENGILVYKVSSSDQAWHTIRSSELGLNYTAESSLTRFFFVAGMTDADPKNTGSAWNPKYEYTVGNFLDYVGFSQKLPPVQDDEFTIQIEKEFKDLDDTNLNKIQEQIKFEISVKDNATREDLGKSEIEELLGTSVLTFENKSSETPEGNLIWNIANRKIDRDKSYTITVKEIDADLPGYNLETTSTARVDKDGATGSPVTGENTAVINGLSGKTTAYVTFKNTYERSESKNVTFTKKWDDAGNAYGTRPKNLTVTLKGTINVEENGTIVEKVLTAEDLGVTLEQTLNSDNAVPGTADTWRYTWENVPVYYDYNGIPIKINYSVEEGPINSDYVYTAGTVMEGDGSDYGPTVSVDQENQAQSGTNALSAIENQALATDSTSSQSVKANSDSESELGAPLHNKYIEYNEATGEYTLNLNVTGAKGEAKGADILFVIDTSGSMADRAGWDGWSSYSYLEGVQELLTEPNGIIDQIFAKDGNVNSVAYVSFAGRGETKNSGWYTDGSSVNELKNSINRLRATGGTNWTYAMQRASSVLAQKRNSDNEKVVIFLSDGEPTYTMKNGRQSGSGSSTRESYYTDAINEVTGSSTLKEAQFYSVYLTDGTKGGMEKFSNGLAQNGVQSEVKDGTDLPDALKDILNQIIPSYKNVSITDKLSEYVEFVEDEPTVTVKVEYADGREETLTEGEDYSKTTENDSVKVELLNGEELSDGATYNISFKVKPTKKAEDDYISNNYTDEGDPGTGITSAGKDGFFSNDESGTELTYTVGEEEPKDVSYPRPVIQVTTHTLTYEKKWEHPASITDPNSDVTLKVGYTDGTTGTIKLTAAESYKKVETGVPITKKIASVIEIKGNSDYTPSYQISSDGTQVTVTNSYSKIETQKITVVKEYADGSGPEVQVALYRSKNGENAELVETVTLNDSNDWKKEWTGLKLTEGSGEDFVSYSYAVREVNIPPHYSSSIDYEYKDNETIATITNTYDPNCEDENFYVANVLQMDELYVNKTWEDDNNVLNARPEVLNVTVDDGKGRTYSFDLNDSNGWEAAKTIPKVADANYTATENWSDDNYNSTSTVYKTSNSASFYFVNTLKSISITVSKSWNDGDIEDRPTSISFRLEYVEKGQDNWSTYGGEDNIYTLTAEDYGEGDQPKAWTKVIDNLPAGYDYRVIETGVTNSEEQKVTTYVPEITSDQDGTSFTITNTLTWSAVKTDNPENEDEGKTLQGATFELRQGEGDDKPVVATGTSAEDGVITWVPAKGVDLNALDGTYTIKETKAPDGYTVNKSVWTVKFDKGLLVEFGGNEETGTADDGVVIKLENEKLYELPETGGSGIYWYMLGGVLLMMAGSLLVYKKRRGEVLRRK